MVEFSRRGIAAVLLVSFVVGMVVERALSLTEPVSRAVIPIARSTGGPLMWMAAGAAVGVFGLTIFRRWRGQGSGDVGGGGTRRHSGRV